MPRRAVCAQIHHQAASAQFPAVLGIFLEATRQRMQASDKFVEGEGFAQVVIGTAVQTRNAILHLGAGGEHQDGHR